MATYRYPTLVWEDHAGLFTACLINGWDSVAAVGRSSTEALRQTREVMQWLNKQGRIHYAPEFSDPALTTFRVDVRGEYKDEQRIFPCAEPLALHVACVHGESRGLKLAVLPRLDLRFYYHDSDGLKDLVTHYVRQKLEGQTPQTLSRMLPPRDVQLHEVSVRVVYKRRRPPQSNDSTLRSVADPVGGRTLRRAFVKPWERDAELQSLSLRLGREGANVILLGEPGVGKTTLLVEAVRQLERAPSEMSAAPSRAPGGPKQGSRSSDADAPASSRHRFWLTNAGRLVAGMRYLGQWEERLEEVIGELARVGGVLCVGNLLELITAGGRTPRDGIAAFLLPYLANQELRMVAEASPAELDACRRLLPGLVEVFQILDVPSFDRPKALVVLERLGTSLTQSTQVALQPEVVAQVHRLFARFAPYRAFPGKAAAFLSRLFEQAERDGRGEIGMAEILDAFVARTGLPELFLRDDAPLAPETVLDSFRAEVIGQDRACEAALDLVTTFKAGLNDPARPVGVLLFCGPTGVGKTALARAVARFFFGHGEEDGASGADSERLVRLDMSEFAGPGAAERLLGTPDGDPSDLIKRLREQPFVVLLLDEIEKASPQVFDVLMGVFDEGRLTDRLGRTTSFCSAVIIMTSNLGAESGKAVGFGGEGDPAFEGEVMSFFRPEFFNRMDAVVTFDALAADTVKSIAAKELRALARREGLLKANLKLTWSDAVVELIASAGFDRRYGARPLQRVLEERVVTPLARFLAETPGMNGEALVLDVASGRITVQRRAKT